ncbi:hypothetical protein ACSFBX_31275 [Variovorax sp. RB2P76]
MRFMPIGPTADRDDGALPERLEYEEFYIAYGECFSIWSEIETRLLALFLLVLKSPDYEAVSSAFYSTTGFRAKLDMINAAVSNSKLVPKGAKDSWPAIHQSVLRSSKRRNQLAHNIVFFGRSANERRKIFLGDPQGPFVKSRLHAHDLKALEESFSTLSMQLYSLWEEIETPG